MSLSERFNKSTLTSMKLDELQNLAQTYNIEIKTVSQKTNKQINKKKAILMDEIMEFKKKEDIESYEKDTGSDFIEEMLLVKELNEKINTLMIINI